MCALLLERESARAREREIERSERDRDGEIKRERARGEREREREREKCECVCTLSAPALSSHTGELTQPEARGHTARRKLNEGTPSVHVRVCDAIIT